jgi:hypothetical protein
MALFKVRPSRGSWAFFVLITVAAVTRRQWARHEQTVIRRDGPAAESARALATCLLGGDVAWVLREDDVAGADPKAAQRALWAARLNAWLQRHANGSLEHDWPARCVAPLDELEGRLQSATERGRYTPETIRQIRGVLQRPAARADGSFRPGEDPASRAVLWQTELLRAVDDETPEARLGWRLASLFSEVRDLSLGTRDRWVPFPLRAELYPMPAAPEVPRWRDVPAREAQIVLASPTVYFYRTRDDGVTDDPDPSRPHRDDGRTHRVDFDRRLLSDNPVGAAVAWREAPRGGVLRASTEAGGALIPLEGTMRVIALPDEPGVTRRGEAFDWQTAASAGGLAWLTLTNGTARLRALRFDDPARWSDPVVLGTPESQMAAVVAPEALDATRWRVTLLRPPSLDVAVEQYVVASTPAGLVVTPGARHEPIVFPVVQRLLSCGSEAVRYVALLGARGVAVLRVEGEQMRVAQATMAAEWGHEPTLRCDAGRALLVGDPAAATAAATALVVTFPVAGDPAVETVPPLPYDRERRPREVLLVDDGLVAVAANASSLRAWRRPLQATRWEPGGYLGSTAPGIGTVRTVRSMRGVSQGRSLAVWIEGDTLTRRTVAVPAEGNNPAGTREETASAPYRVLMMSEDSGRSFAGR